METTVNNTVNTNAATEQPQQPQQNRRRESGNFRGQGAIKDFRELDPSQFPQRPREERVPMWAQQLQKSIDLMSQEQEKMKEQLTAIKAPEAYDDTKLTAVVSELKQLCDAQFAKVRENQKHSHENIIAGLKDACILLQQLHTELHPKAKRTLVWKIFHPIDAIKEWWAAAAEDRRQRKAAKLRAQLEALQAQK